jgi:hypothetical protein
MTYAVWHAVYVETDFMTIEPAVLHIKFDNRTWQEKAEIYFVKVVGLILLVMIYVLSPHLAVTYIAIAALTSIALAISYFWLFKISQTEIRPQEGVIFQYFAHPIFSTTRHFNLQEYEIITSSWAKGEVGAHWVSVLLSGRRGSVEIARFGPNAGICEGGRFDHPDAKALRSQLATQLGLKDLGVL